MKLDPRHVYYAVISCSAGLLVAIGVVIGEISAPMSNAGCALLAAVFGLLTGAMIAMGMVSYSVLFNAPVSSRKLSLKKSQS